MAEEKKEHLSNREKYGSDFTCPDCGRTAAEGWELVGILKKSALCQSVRIRNHLILTEYHRAKKSFTSLGNPPKYLNVDTIVFKKIAEE